MIFKRRRKSAGDESTDAVEGVPAKDIEAVAQLLADSKSALFITGAGLSADSGMPTYRGIGGLYDEALTKEGLPIEEVLSGPMFRKRPELVWHYIAQIAHSVVGAKPNRGHEVIAELERRMPRVWTLTQNVDEFHTRAGSKNVIEMHGNVHRLHCPMCPYRTHVDDWSKLEIPPECPTCANVLRPEVVLFGEMLPDDAIRRLQLEHTRGFDVVISIGTSSLFPYIAQPVIEAARRGTPTVEINLGTTDISDYVRHKLTGRAASVLDAIYAAYLARVG